MMRAGMFVAAQSLEASTCNQILTDFVREEDASMKSGKLDEELSRMSTIADEVTPGSMILFNESIFSDERARKESRNCTTKYCRHFLNPTFGLRGDSPV